MDLPLPRQGQRSSEGPPREPAESCPRDRLEGADPIVRPLPTPERRRQEAAGRRRRNRARDRRLLVGDRPRGRTGVSRVATFGCTGPGAEQRRGTPVASYVAGPAPDARPLDRGKPRDENTEGGTQPADKSLIDRRLSSASGPVQPL